MDVHLRVIVYEPGAPGRVVEIPSTVEAIQGLVGGFFEVFWDETTAAFVYVNEDGLARKLRNPSTSGVLTYANRRVARRLAEAREVG
jgi:hypothetical protein